MKNLKYLVLCFLCVSFLVTSCKKDTVVNEAETLVQFLESADSPLGKDYPSTDMPAIVTAEGVQTLNLTGQVHIIDIRKADDFALGHIKNAVNVASTDLFTHMESIDVTAFEKVAIVCYSGQTAAWATALLRLNGYGNVFSMKWGMCSWHNDFAGSWPGNAKSLYTSQMVTEATAKAAAGDMPELMTDKETGIEILEARLAAVLAEGFGAAAVSAADVFAAKENYYIVNYWSEAHYSEAGHIPGAMQYTPKVAMQFAEDLKTLPTDKTIAVYCYTGQTSANMAAYLRTLGYDAKSILFGTSGMMLDKVTELGYTHWDDHYIMGYDYEQ